MRTIISAFTLCTLLSSSLAFAIPESAAKVIQINEPIINFVAKSKSEGVLSFEMVNKGQHPHSLISVSSPAAQHAQLDQDTPGQHAFRLETVTLNPKTTYKFAPQSSVVRLKKFDPSQHTGGMVPVTLVFDDGSKVEVSAKVQGIN